MFLRETYLWSVLSLGFNQDISNAGPRSPLAVLDAAYPERTSWMLINHWAGNLDRSGSPPRPRVPPFLPRSEDLQLAEEPSLGGLDVFGPRQTAQTAKKV